MPLLEAKEPRLASDVVSRYKETEFALWDSDLACTDRVTDEILAGSYLRFKRDGLLEQIFYEGVPSLNWFMNRFLNAKKREADVFVAPSVEVLMVLRKREDGIVEQLGLGWLNSRTNVANLYDKMEGGFGFFRDYHGQRDLMVQAMRLMIEFSFRYLGIGSLFGCTPEKNRAALRMSRLVGFEQTTVLPHYTAWKGEPCGAVFSVMTKERW